MKSSVLFTLLLSSLFVLSSCRSITGLPIIGEDGEGRPKTFFVKEKLFVSNTQDLLDSVQETTLLSLEKNQSHQWLLRTAVVGLGVKFEVGVGPIIKVSATPKIRMAFSNSQQPVIP